MWFTVLITTLISSSFIACHVIYRSDYPFDIFKLFLLVFVLPVMWVTVLIKPLISSSFSCWSLYWLSGDLPFWLPLWYLPTFLVGYCIACHVIYSSDYPFDILKISLLVIALPVMWFNVLITPLISSNFSCWSLYFLSCDLPFWLPLFLLVIVLPVMWFTVLITPLISSNFSCWSLYCLSCDLPFWLPLWYLQTFLVGHCISCHVIYRSDYPFDIFKLFLLVIVFPVIWFTVLITPLISCHLIYRSDYPIDIFKLFLLVIVLPVMWFIVLITPLISSNLSCRSLYCLSCDLQFWLPLWYLQTFLVGHCIACNVIYCSDYPFDIFKLFLLVSVLPVMWFTVLITTLISSNFSCWSCVLITPVKPFLWFTVLITLLI